MNRVLAVGWLLSATAALLILFQIKQDVQQLEEQLTAANRQILREQESLHVLEAEWSYLNRPERIAQLARQHLGMGPLSPAQIVDFADLPPRGLPGDEQNGAPDGLDSPSAALPPLLARSGRATIGASGEVMRP